MENKTYEKPTLTVVRFETKDICAQSGCFWYDQNTNIIPGGGTTCVSGEHYDGSGTTDEL